ncbi:MAG: addiction module protein [Chthoniobacteraceae bacterium]|jgi:putative addiction module component (TIGR02574 family)
MPKALQEITHDVLELPRNQRLALAQFLLSLDDDGSSPDVDAAWDTEIRTRLKAYDEGRVEAIPFDQVRQTMGLRFAQ